MESPESRSGLAEGDHQQRRLSDLSSGSDGSVVSVFRESLLRPQNTSNLNHRHTRSSSAQDGMPTRDTSTPPAMPLPIRLPEADMALIRHKLISSPNQQPSEIWTKHQENVLGLMIYNTDRLQLDLINFEENVSKMKSDLNEQLWTLGAMIRRARKQFLLTESVVQSLTPECMETTAELADAVNRLKTVESDQSKAKDEFAEAIKHALTAVFHQLQLSEAAHAQEIQLLKGAHSQEISRLEGDHAREISRLEGDHAREISRLEAKIDRCLRMQSVGSDQP